MALAGRCQCPPVTCVTRADKGRRRRFIYLGVIHNTRITAPPVLLVSFVIIVEKSGVKTPNKDYDVIYGR